MSSKLQKIKDLLKVKKMTYEELSVEIDKSKPTVVNYFNEKSKIDIDTIEKIAKALNVPVSYFFEETTSAVSNSGNGNNHSTVIIGGEKYNVPVLLEKIKGLESRLKDKEEIITLLKKKS